jgi:hypothetical protein
MRRLPITISLFTVLFFNFGLTGFASELRFFAKAKKYVWSLIGKGNILEIIG